MTQTVELRPDGYTLDWHQVALSFKVKHNNTCETCGWKLGSPGTTTLGVHHINHIKHDNRPQNLKCLCCKCHLREESKWRKEHSYQAKLAYEINRGQTILEGFAPLLLDKPI